jgi:hypothetical protein
MEDYLNPQKLYNTGMFIRHMKKPSKKMDNWKTELRRIRLIEPCSTKHGGSDSFTEPIYDVLDPSTNYREKRYLNQCKKYIQHLYFKCDHCSNKAIIESNNDEYLCYECNEVIDSKIKKTIVNKKRKPLLFNHKQYKVEYEQNYTSKLRVKSFTKKLLQDHDDSDYKTFLNQRTNVFTQFKKIERDVLQQTIPPYLNKDLYFNSWVSKTAPKYCNMNKNKYEKAFPKLPSLTCSVCFESSCHLTKCNHLVCKRCLDRWKVINNTCPICRANMSREYANTRY